MERVVIIPFQARHGMELALSRGEVVETLSVHTDVGPGWWLGRKRVPQHHQHHQHQNNNPSNTYNSTYNASANNGSNNDTFLTGLFPANHTASIISLHNKNVYAPKISQKISKVHKEIGFLRGGTPESKLVPTQRRDSPTEHHDGATFTMPPPAPPPPTPSSIIPNSSPSPSSIISNESDTFKSNKELQNLVFALQQELLEKDQHMLQLDKSNQHLKHQLQNITVASKQTISALEKQVQELKAETTVNINSIHTLEEKYTADKHIWKQKYEILEKDSTEEIERVKEMCKTYKLDISELQSQLELEEQTVQALEEYRVNLEEDFKRLQQSLNLQHDLKFKALTSGNARCGTAKLLEQDLFEVKARFSDLLSMLKNPNTGP